MIFVNAVVEYLQLYKILLIEGSREKIIQNTAESQYNVVIVKYNQTSLAQHLCVSLQ